MRAFVTQLLSEDAGLRAIGLPVDAVYSAENVDTPPEKPFIVVRWTTRAPGLGSSRSAPSQPALFDVWCYDKRGDFSRIDAMLARIREIFSTVQGEQTQTGWITQIDWQSDGPDSYDDVWVAIVRTATYRAVGSYLSG